MLQVSTTGTTRLSDPHYLNTDFPTVLNLLRRRANARNVGYASNLTGEKRSISTIFLSNQYVSLVLELGFLCFVVY